MCASNHPKKSATKAIRLQFACSGPLAESITCTNANASSMPNHYAIMHNVYGPIFLGGLSHLCRKNILPAPDKNCSSNVTNRHPVNGLKPND